MQPLAWATAITEYLERRAIVGAVLPNGAVDARDRYQPSRVAVRYGWTGAQAASTEMTFRVIAAEDREDFDATQGAWTATSRVDIGGWGDAWELVTIAHPSTGPLTSSQEFQAPGRFRVRVSISDEPEPDGSFTRRIEVENLREQAGVLHGIRIRQGDLPDLVGIRPYGIDEDIYYRATGLIGTLDDAGMLFAPHAILPEPLRRPLAGPEVQDALANGILEERVAQLLNAMGIERLHLFQAEAVQRINQAFETGDDTPLMLTTGTAGGKTEAFFLPLLNDLTEDVQYRGVQGLFVYPTKALASDQARRFFRYLRDWNQGRQWPISLGLLDGDTSWDLDAARQQEATGRMRSPFVTCPGCGGHLRFVTSEQGQALAVPTCSSCGEEFPWLRFNRRDLTARWPNILLTNPDMLHKMLSDTFAWSNQTILGREAHLCECGQFRPASTATIRDRPACTCGRAISEPAAAAPRLIVFDEAHVLKGSFGSQVSLLIARMRAILCRYGQTSLFVGVSATIGNPEEFGRQLFGTDVELVVGRDERLLDAEPTRYHLFIMPVLVTVLNAMGHLLASIMAKDYEEDEANRVLVFSDSKRTVYQLEQSLPEFYGNLPGELLEDGPPATRSHTGDLAPDERRKVEADFDNALIRILLATQTLEVGVDFQNLQLEIQSGATYSYNDYIQRVGRAGRGGVPALVVCVLRPMVPLDYYYFEHCRELVQFSPETLEEVPARSDNPFFIERHAPAAIQDWLIAAVPGARLAFSVRDAISRLDTDRAAVQADLESTFIHPHTWDQAEIRASLGRAINRAAAQLAVRGEGTTLKKLEPIIAKTLRGSDIEVPIEAPDFDQHRRISLAAALAEDEIEGDEELPPDVEEDEE
jgi:hypothetical protein